MNIEELKECVTDTVKGFLISGYPILVKPHGGDADKFSFMYFDPYTNREEHLFVFPDGNYGNIEEMTPRYAKNRIEEMIRWRTSSLCNPVVSPTYIREKFLENDVVKETLEVISNTLKENNPHSVFDINVTAKRGYRMGKGIAQSYIVEVDHVVFPIMELLYDDAYVAVLGRDGKMVAGGLRDIGDIIDFTVNLFKFYASDIDLRIRSEFGCTKNDRFKIISSISSNGIKALVDSVSERNLINFVFLGTSNGYTFISPQVIRKADIRTDSLGLGEFLFDDKSQQLKVTIRDNEVFSAEYSDSVLEYALKAISITREREEIGYTWFKSDTYDFIRDQICNNNPFQYTRYEDGRIGIQWVGNMGHEVFTISEKISRDNVEYHCSHRINGPEVYRVVFKDRSVIKDWFDFIRSKIK